MIAGTVYFTQGAIGIASISFPLYLRAIGFSISAIAGISAIAAFPWLIKIVYGLISDALPIARSRRKSYLILYALLASLGWVFLGIFPPQQIWIMGALILANIGFAGSDVVTDALVVEYSDHESSKTYQTVSWGMRSIGALLSGVIGGFLAHELKPQVVFLMTAALPLISLVAVLTFQEEPLPHERPKLSDLLRRGVRSVFQGSFKWFVCLLLVSGIPAAVGTPFFFYMKETLKFDEVFLGLLQSVTWLGAMIGCFMFLKFLRPLSFYKMLLWSVACGSFQLLMLFMIKEPLGAFIVSFLGGILGYLSLLPLFAVAAKLVHGTGMEGFLFSLLMALFNFGQVLGQGFGGVFYEALGLNLVILLGILASASGFIFAARLKSID